MPFEAPTPGIFARGSENRHIVQSGVPVRGFVFELEQDGFETDDVRCFGNPASAEAAPKQRMGQRTLRLSHIFERKTFARFRDEMPVEALLVLEFEDCLGALFGLK